MLVVFVKSVNLKEMRLYFVFTLFFLFSFKCNAQNFIIVLKSLNENRIPFVSVYDTTKKIYTLSDSHGILQLPDDDYHLHFHSIGFRDTTIEVNQANSNDTLTIYLEEDIYTLQEVTINRKPERKITKYTKIKRAGGTLNFSNQSSLTLLKCISLAGETMIGYFSIVTSEESKPKARSSERLKFLSMKYPLIMNFWNRGSLLSRDMNFSVTINRKSPITLFLLNDS